MEIPARRITKISRGESPLRRLPRRGSRLAACLSVLFTWLLLSTHPLGQSTQSTGGKKGAEPVTPLVEREEVRFVTLDLVVEEHGGAGGRSWHPARSLTKEQIHLLVGGQEMTLDLFENWCAGVPPGPPAGSTVAASSQAGSPARPGTSTPAEGAPHDVSEGDSSPGDDAAARAANPPGAPSSQSSQERDASNGKPGSSTQKYILYFDLEHLTMGGRNYSYRSAMDWAAKVAKPTDEVMIVTGGMSLRIVRPLIPAAMHLEDDLRRAMEDFSSQDLWANGEEQRLLEIRRLRKIDPDAAEALARSYTTIDYDYTRRSLENLDGLMALFEKVQGTKNLVFFGETVRLVPGAEYYEDSDEFIGGFSPAGAVTSDVYPQLDRLTQAANERNVRIYTVQPAGLKTGKDIEGAMTMLATETGAAHVQGTNRIGDILDRVAEDSSCFYRVGFRFPSRHSGKTERIVVRIGPEEGQYRVRYRRSLVDPTREQQEEESIRAAFLSPESARTFPILVTARRLFDHPMGSRFRIEVSVPLEGLMIRPGPLQEGRHVSVLFGGEVIPLRSNAQPPMAQLAALGTDTWAQVDPKKETWGFDRRAEIRLPATEGSRRAISRIVYANEIDVPPGDYRIVAVVEDGLTRSLSTALTDLASRASHAALGEPLLGFEDAGVLIVPAAPPEAPSQAAGAGPLKSILPAGASIPFQQRVAGEGDAIPPDSLTSYFPICAAGADPGKPPPDAGSNGELGSSRILRRLTCGKHAESLPPIPLPTLPGKAGCTLLPDPLSLAVLRAGACRIEVTLEQPGKPDETGKLDFSIVPGAAAPARDH